MKQISELSFTPHKESVRKLALSAFPRTQRSSAPVGIKPVILRSQSLRSNQLFNFILSRVENYIISDSILSKVK